MIFFTTPKYYLLSTNSVVAPDSNVAINVDPNGVRTSNGTNEAKIDPFGVIIGDGQNATSYGLLSISFSPQIPYNGGLISGVGSINFVDGSSINTAPSPGIPDAPQDGNYYARRNGAWEALQVASVYDINGNPVSAFIFP